MALNFITTYMPSMLELTQEEVLDVRQRLEIYARESFPDIETEPNSVLGDLLLTPQAYQIAAIEKGMNRFMSDLDLGNIANNIVYNCDFVEQYMKNFAVGSIADAVKISGVLRLVFNTNKQYILDRGTLFKTGDIYLSIYLPNKGPYTINKVGEAVISGTNGTTLIDSGSPNSYFADVPVIAAVVPEGDVAPIVKGASMSISTIIPELGSIAALYDFTTATETISTSALAKRARETMYSASLNTRMGAIRFVNSMCPFVESVFAIKNGDREMLRDYRGNAQSVSSGCMDLYVRSKSFPFVEEQTVRLDLSEDTEYFEGEWDYVGQPYYIESITNQDIDADTIEADILSYNTKGLGALAAYTEYEKFRIRIKNKFRDEAHLESYYLYEVDENGKRYANFLIKYRTDPMLHAISATINNSDYTPINSNIMPKGFIPIIIRKFNIQYVKKDGVTPDLDTAKEEIKSYLDYLGAPNAYSDAEIARIMGEAGVKYVIKIDVNAYVQWSLGNKTYDYDSNIVDTKNDTNITSSAALRISYPSDRVAITADDMYACSIRTVRYYCMDDAISFTAVREM